MSSVSQIIYQKNKEMPWQTIEHETIIIDPETPSSFELNELGSFIWQHINGQTTRSQIVTLICQEYLVDETQAQQDLNGFVLEMQQNKLLVEI